MHTLTVDWLTLDSLRSILSDGKLALSADCKARIEAAREVVEQIVASGKTVYGINTGFGKFSETKISDHEIEELQRRIVLSHACGVGEPIPPHICKIMMLLKIQSLCYGHSGCSLSVVELLIGMFNANIIPVVPSKGSVGASGDLAPLSHMALAMIGEGDCFVDGKQTPSAAALKSAGLAPITLGAKDGLAILNGTQTMGAYLAHALMEAENMLEKSTLVAAMSIEALTGTAAAFDPRIHDARHQVGQKRVAAALRELLEGSALVDSRHQVQDAYSLRCIPQIHGAAFDTFEHVKSVLEREINGVTDNPLVFSETGDVISGGNFHGEPLAMVADFLSIAMAEIASVSERRIAHMVDPHVSQLPAFLVREGGLNSGYMIPQYTAAALVSENKVLAHPASVDSVPTSANKEDHVSMGTHATRKVNTIIENTWHVLSIELLCAVQGIDLAGLAPSPKLGEIHRNFRACVPTWETDRYMAEDMQKSVAFLKS